MADAISGGGIFCATTRKLGHWAAIRAASIASSDHPMTVTLFPMVHIGEPEFYQQVYADAFAHDVVLYEGI